MFLLKIKMSVFLFDGRPGYEGAGSYANFVIKFGICNFFRHKKTEAHFRAAEKFSGRTLDETGGLEFFSGGGAGQVFAAARLGRTD